MGHTKHTPLYFQNKARGQFRYNHGGTLRQKRRGRFSRPLSTRIPIHLVFKADRKAYKQGLRSPRGFAITQRILKKYSKHFFVKLEQVAVCQDHIHILVRFSRRSLGQHFLRVVAGQIAQEYQKEGLLKPVTGTPQRAERGRRVTDTPDGAAREAKVVELPMKALWKHRPFTRVVVGGWRAVQTVRNYVRLNEKEARGQIPYRKTRLRGLSSTEWELLWS